MRPSQEFFHSEVFFKSRVRIFFVIQFVAAITYGVIQGVRTTRGRTTENLLGAIPPLTGAPSGEPRRIGLVITPMYGLLFLSFSNSGKKKMDNVFLFWLTL